MKNKKQCNLIYYYAIIMVNVLDRGYTNLDQAFNLLEFFYIRVNIQNFDPGVYTKTDILENRFAKCIC